jgi:hypothetical protein
MSLACACARNAVKFVPDPEGSYSRSCRAVLSVFVIATFPSLTCNRSVGAAVPMPTFPVAVMRTRSVLFVYNASTFAAGRSSPTPVSTIAKRSAGAAVPMPTFPVAVMRSCSVLFVYNASTFAAGRSSPTPVSTIAKRSAGAAVPMPTFPVAVTRTRSVLFVRMTSGCAFVVPRNSVPVMLLPVRDQKSPPPEELLRSGIHAVPFQ